MAWQDVAKEWSVRRLPEDFAALVSIRAEFLPDEIKDKIKGEALTATTGRWDTHPCPSERLANIQRTDALGIFDLDGPAGTLFGNLPALCREATQHHYTSLLGIPAVAARLVPTPETFLNALATREFDQAAAQLFNAAAEFWSRWFRLPIAIPASMKLPAILARLRNLPALRLIRR